MKQESLSMVLGRILVSLNAGKPLVGVLQEILRSANQLAGSSQGVFVVVDHDKGELITWCTEGPGWSDEKKAAVLKTESGIAGHVINTGKAYFCADTAKDPLYKARLDSVKSELVLPVFIDNKVWGMIDLYWTGKNAQARNLSSEMETFVQLAGEAIHVCLGRADELKRREELTRAEQLAFTGRLLSGFAHDINNPLAAIMGGASVLSYDVTDPVQKQTLDAIATEAQRAADLVKNLLALVRRQTLRREEREINTMVRDVSALMRHPLKQKSIRLRLSLPEQSPCAEIQPLQIQQVLLTVLGHAERAIEKEGRTDGDILIDVSELDGMAQIEIAGNGTAAGESVTGEQGGELDLNAAREIMTAHGGVLSSRDGAHAGTVFNIQLPVRSARAGVEKVAAGGRILEGKSSGVQGTGLKILIVDDEEQIRQAIARFLGFKGLQVQQAIDGVEACELAGACDFDVVVSDVRMPRMGGFDLYRKLNDKNPAYKKRFIFMTGNLKAGETQEVLQKSGCCCIEKPFQLEAIFELIQRQMRPTG